MSYDPAQDPFRWITLWKHENLGEVADTRPAFANASEVLRDHAEASQIRRTAAYPELVRRGAMDAAEAENDLAVWRMLAALFRWVVDGEGERPVIGGIDEVHAALDLARQRIEQEMARGNRGEVIHAQWNAVAAMRWHLRDSHAVAGLIATARFNHTIRAEQSQRYCHQCERWQAVPALSCRAAHCGLPAQPEQCRAA